MKIGLIDVDGSSKFPNLPLMKYSAWHKKQGDTVEWYDPMFGGHYDKVYMSKVFSFTPDYEYFIDSDEIVKGGVRLLYRFKREWERDIPHRARSSVAGRNRTHLSRLFHLRHYRYCIRIYDSWMPKRMRFLYRWQERRKKDIHCCSTVRILEWSEKYCITRPKSYCGS